MVGVLHRYAKKMRILLISFYILAVGGTSFADEPSPSPSPPGADPASVVKGKESAERSIDENVGVTKDLIQIVFFVVVATLAILSYLQARKSLFTPIRTETFKLQLKAFEDVLLFFEKHEESDITQAFDYEAILHLNAREVYDSYTCTFFRDEIDIDALRKSREESKPRPFGALVTGDFAEKHFELATDHIQREPPEKKEEEPKTPAVILAQWMKYDHGMIHYTKRFNDAQETLRRFQISPVLPRELKDLIKEFDQLATKNLFALGEVLTEAAKEMPDKYPSLDSVKKSSSYWLWERFNKKLTRLGDAQNKILEYLSNYLDVDLLCSQRA